MTHHRRPPGGSSMICSWWNMPETSHIDTGLNATDQVGQVCSGQQLGWAHHQSFKPDLMGEGDALLCDRQEPGNTATSECSRWKPQSCPREIQKDSSRKVTQLLARLKCLCTKAHRKHARGIESQSEIRRLQPNCYHRNVMGWII